MAKKQDKPKQTRKHHNIEVKDFINAWCKAKSHQEIADKLGVDKRYVAGRGFTLRKLGVKLPTLKKQPIFTKEKINEYNAMIAKAAD